MKINWKTMPLLGILIGFIIGNRDRIAYEMKTVPRILRWILILALALFITLITIHGLDLMP